MSNGNDCVHLLKMDMTDGKHWTRAAVRNALQGIARKYALEVRGETPKQYKTKVCNGFLT